MYLQLTVYTKAKVKGASVNAAQISQWPQNIPTNYIMWFGCKLPLLHSVSCSKDIWELSSRGHIFQLLLTKAPFHCLRHFRINKLAFPSTYSEAMLTWPLRYLIMPANRAQVSCRLPGGQNVPARRLRQRVQVQRARQSRAAWPSPTTDGRHEAGRSSPRASPTPRLLLSPFEKPRFPPT